MGERQQEERKETRRANQARIARLISEAGTISKNELAARLGLSMPTVLQHVKVLTEAGYITESGEYGSTGGRKAKCLSVVGDMGFAVGMDITESYISYVLTDMRRELVRKARIRVPFAKSSLYYEAMGNWLQVFLEQAGIGQEKILGVGISLPGVVDPDEKLLLQSHTLQAENMGFKRLESLTGYPCEVGSDAGGAAYAELAGESTDAVYLSLNDTVGGAIYLNQEFYTGEQGKGARFGHMRREKNGRPCYCGSRGCLDAYCSAKALRGEDKSLDVFFEKVQAREAGYRKRLEEYLDTLAAAAVQLHVLFGCDVVLGGEAGRYLGGYRRELDRLVAEYSYLDPDTSFVRIGKCQAEASAFGMAIREIDRFFERL